MYNSELRLEEAGQRQAWESHREVPVGENRRQVAGLNQA